MQESDLYVYHIVTRKKMNLGQIISFDKELSNADSFTASGSPNVLCA